MDLDDEIEEVFYQENGIVGRNQQEVVLIVQSTHPTSESNAQQQESVNSTEATTCTEIQQQNRRRKRVNTGEKYVLTKEQLIEKNSRGELSFEFRKASKVPRVNETDKTNRSKSNVWEVFQSIIDDTTEPKRVVSNYVKCSCCSNFFQYNGETTTVLLRHMACAKNQPSISKFLVPKKSITFKEADITAVRDAAMKFVVKDIRPYYAIEGVGLNDLCKVMLHLGQKYPTMSDNDFDKIMPCRKTVTRDVVKKSHELRNIISKDLRNALDFAGGFACTSDIWIDSFRRKSYLSITAHLFLFENDKIVTKNYILNMDIINEEKKSGPVILTEIIRILSEYGISPDEIKKKITFITDRGGNMINALTNYKRLSCYAHVINNIVHHMCDLIDMKDIITKTAALVRYIKITGMNDSPMLRSSLKSYCETRFNTVVDMIDSVERNFDEIYELLREKQRKTNQTKLTSKINCLDQNQLKSIAGFLRLFQEITTDVEGEKYETIHRIWPAYRKILKQLMHNNDDIPIVKDMKEAGNIYINLERNKDDVVPQKIHKLAVFLHPAFKSLSFCSIIEKTEIYNHARLEIGATLDDNDDTYVNIMSVTNEPEKSNSLFDEFLSAEESQDNQELAVTDEVERYINFKIEKISNIDKFDSKEWWIRHSKFLPKLFKLYLRTYCVPATSCPAERSFSGSSNILTTKRNCLLPENINCLTLASNMYRNN